jgi:hypothetical protein
MCIVGDMMHGRLHSKLWVFWIEICLQGCYVGVRLFYYIGQDLFRLGFNSPKGDSSLVIELSLDFDIKKYSIIKTCNHFKVLLLMTR